MFQGVLAHAGQRLLEGELAVVGAAALILGVQLLMFGVLSDLIVTVNREQTAQFKRLAQAMNDDNVTLPIDDRVGDGLDDVTDDETETDDGRATSRTDGGAAEDDR